MTFDEWNILVARQLGHAVKLGMFLCYIWSASHHERHTFQIFTGAVGRGVCSAALGAPTLSSRALNTFFSRTRFAEHLSCRRVVVVSLSLKRSRGQMWALSVWVLDTGRI